MSDAESIVLALRALEEAADTVLHPVLSESVASTSYDLMGISLMAHIENQLVFRSIIHVMQGHYKLHGTEARAKVTRVHRAALYHILTDLFAKLTKLVHTQTLDVCRRIYFAENFICIVFHRAHIH
jgi:hypothetical protein